jgi:tetratricopeptide (TPR) repeat protein
MIFLTDLGDEIRKLRKELNMSQSALAGNELTKGTISLIENGKVKPTIRSLEFIAKQLGRPLSFFTGDLKYDLNIEELSSIIDSLMLENQFEESIRFTQQALELAFSIANQKTISLMYISLGMAQYRLLRFEEALDSFEKANKLIFQNYDLKISIESLFHCGNCHYKLGQFHLAKLDYERVIDKSRSTKTFLEIYYYSRLYLGSTLYCLGEIQESIQLYKNLYYVLNHRSYPLLKIDAGMGLAWSSHQLDNTPFALSLSYQIRELSLQNGNYNLNQIETNHGVFLSKSGCFDKAFDLWNRALSSFESNNNHIAQATVIEEIALQFLRLGKIDLAEESSHEALALLGLADENNLRGRIYRILGTVYKMRHNKQQALQWYRLALQCFRSSKSKVELSLTQSSIESLATLD